MWGNALKLLAVGKYVVHWRDPWKSGEFLHIFSLNIWLHYAGKLI
jgi:hypothetical protein